VCLQAAAEDKQLWCRWDMLWQTVPNVSSSDKKGSVANSWQPCTCTSRCNISAITAYNQHVQCICVQYNARKSAMHMQCRVRHSINVRIQQLLKMLKHRSDAKTLKHKAVGTIINCNCNWGTCIVPPPRRPRAHHRVSPYLGARRQNA